MKLLLIIPIHIANTKLKKDFTTRLRKHLIPILDQDTVLDIVCLPSEATSSIECRIDRNINSPLVVELALNAKAQGYEGIFVTDMDMCGVDLCREALNIPIVGGFRPSVFTALMLAEKFSIITILDQVVSMQRGHVHHFGLTENFVSFRVADIPVSMLLENHPYCVEALVDQSIKAIECDGAESIVFGCTGIMELTDKVKQALMHKGYDIPVIDPNRVAMSQLQLMVKNRLSQSKKTFMTPSVVNINTERCLGSIESL